MPLKKILLFLLIFSSLGLLVSLLRWQSWSIPVDNSEALYSYFAERLFKPGFIPYRDAFEQKLVGIYFIYKLGYLLFGTSQYALRMLSLINSIFATSLVFLTLLLIKRNFKWSYFLAIFYAFLTNSFSLDALTAKPEFFIATLLILSLLLFTHYIKQPRLAPLYGLLIGLFIGFAILIKQSAYFDVLIFPIWLYFHRRKNLKTFLPTYLVAAFLPVILCYTAFWLLGVWPYFWEAVGTFQSAYTIEGLASIFNTVILHLNIFWLVQYFQYTELLLIGSLVLYWLHRKLVWKDPVCGLFLITILVTLVQIKIQWRFVGGYHFPLVAPIIFFYACFLSFKFTKKLIIVIFILFLLGWGRIWLLPAKEAHYSYNGKGVELNYDLVDLGNEIKNKTSPEQKIINLTDETEIYFYSERESPCRFLQSAASWLPTFYTEITNGLLQNDVAVVIAFDHNITPKMREIMIKQGFKQKPSIVQKFDVNVYWKY